MVPCSRVLIVVAGLALVPFTRDPSAASIVTPVRQLSLYGSSGSERLGESIDAGDLEGDGTPEFVVGAPLTAGRGSLFAFNRLGAVLFTVPGMPSSGFGTEVDIVGDTNGDGVPDLLIGAAGERSAVLLSGPDRSPLLQDRFFLYQVGPDAGFAMDGLGDVDGDGGADFAISRRGSLGTAATVFSGATGDIISSLDGGPDGFLATLVSMGDLDGDGISEVAAGRYGSTAVFSAADGRMLFAAPTYDVVGAADVDGDGAKDLLVGVGASVHVYSGRTGTLLYQVTTPGLPPCSPSSCYFRVALAGLGDVDGDGHEDFAASVGNAEIAGMQAAGTVAIFSGATGSQLARVDGQGPGENLGWSLAGPGDVDGDGVPDLLVGAPGALNESSLRSGAAFLYRLYRGPAPIPIDVMPGRCPNVLARRGGPPLEVAMLGAPGIDLRELDPSSVRLAGIAPLRERRHSTDLTPGNGADACGCSSDQSDGLADRVFVFDPTAVRSHIGAAGLLNLTANLLDGRAVAGGDCLALEALSTAQPFELGFTDERGASVWPRPIRRGQSVHIRYRPGAPGTSAPPSVFDVRGRRIALLGTPKPLASGEHEIEWDGRGRGGLAVQAGWFFVRESGGNPIARVLVLP